VVISCDVHLAGKEHMGLLQITNAHQGEDFPDTREISFGETRESEGEHLPDKNFSCGNLTMVTQGIASGGPGELVLDQ